MKYFTNLFFLFILLFSISSVFSQKKVIMHEEPSISGGAEYNIILNEAIKSGNTDLFTTSDGYISPPFNTETITVFDGFDYSDNPTENGGFSFIPPDPSMAAGGDRVIAVVNTMIEARDKLGALLYRDALKDFFSTLTPTTFTFDPKVIYDQYEDRFVVVTLEQVQSGSNPDPGNISRILVAVSKTSTPATATSADWYYTAIDSKVDIGGTEHWADYPGFAIDEEAVYITNNMFAFSPSSGYAVRLWIIDKGTVGGFYGGGTAGVSIYDPYSGGGSATTTQPAHVFGTGGAGTGVGTFLVSYSGFTSEPTEFVQVVRVDDPLTTPTFTQEFVPIGDIEGPSPFPALTDAPQLGSTAEIEVNDRRALHAVWRMNYLWMTTTILPNSGPDVNQTTAHWIKLNTSTLGATILGDQGDVGGEDIAANTYTFFPSIAVNSNLDVVVGFAACGSSIYAGAYYAGRLFGDPAGATGASTTIRAGTDFYLRTFGGPRNRWGDYSGACVDPSDDLTLWVFNEYAITRGSGTPPEDGRWGTVYTKVPIGDLLPVELVSFSADTKENSVRLQWSTATEIDNYGFEIERKLSEHNRWEKIGFIEGSGNSNSPHSYVFIDKNPAGGNDFYYRLKQIDNNGAFEYSNEIELNFSPQKYSISQNFPNPFNPTTVIKFTLIEKSNVTLKIMNVLGETIREVVNDEFEAGIHNIEINAGDLPSGIYFYNVNIGDKISETKKMIVLK